jgi:hypothetical protein
MNFTNALARHLITREEAFAIRLNQVVQGDISDSYPLSWSEEATNLRRYEYYRVMRAIDFIAQTAYWCGLIHNMEDFVKHIDAILLEYQRWFDQISEQIVVDVQTTSLTVQQIADRYGLDRAMVVRIMNTRQILRHKPKTIRWPKVMVLKTLPLPSPIVELQKELSGLKKQIAGLEIKLAHQPIRRKFNTHVNPIPPRVKRNYSKNRMEITCAGCGRG